MAKEKSTGRSQDKQAGRAKTKSQPVRRPTPKKPTKRVASIAPPDTATRIAANNRERRAIARALDQQREKTLTAYRAQFRQFAATLAAGKPKAIFAEGDSWFNYPLGRGVISQLAGLISTPIANFAWPGAETRQLLGVHEREEIEKRFRDGPQRGKTWDVLLFSGGGNDIVGDPMVLFLTRGAYDPLHPEGVLNDRFSEVLNLVIEGYKDLIALRDHLSPGTLIMSHGYDYAWASGKGACWTGPWLQPSLDYAQVPRGLDQHKVVIAMLDRFESELHKLSAASNNFVVVPTHQTLLAEADWANELHPKDPGFHAIARKFKTVLEQRFGGDI